MGLDMNLLKREKSSTNNEDWESVCYWRKANQIRNWFSRNLDDFQDDGTTLVTKADLESLLEDCERVLEEEDEDLGRELLPTSSGFFFGSQDYDEWYFRDIEHTVEALKEILENTDFDKYDIAYNEWY